MERKETIASIKLSPRENGKLDIHISMPIWLRKDDVSGKIYISLALLGGIETVAESEEDIDTALKEAAFSFFFAANKFGKGIMGELELLDWRKKNSASFRFKVPKDRMPSKYSVKNLPGSKFRMTGAEKVSKSLSLNV